MAAPEGETAAENQVAEGTDPDERGIDAPGAQASDVADERGIDELIEIADEIPDQLGLSVGLAEIRASARAEGLSVTVDVHGMLVALEIGESALELGPDALAAEIARLSAEAGTRALHKGMQAIRAGCVPAVAAAVEDALPQDDAPAEEPAPASPTQEPAPASQPRPSRRPPRSDDDDEDGFVLKPV